MVEDTLIWEAMQLGPLWVLRETAPTKEASTNLETVDVASSRPPLPSTPVTEPESRARPMIPAPPKLVEPVPEVVQEKTSSISLEMIQKASWEELLTYASTCPLMQLTRTTRPVIVGQGSLTPRLMIIGHALSPDDERVGLPMQGVPGRLLDNILARLGLSREQGVYITTLYKTRHDPTIAPTERQQAQMKAILLRQIECLKPEFVWMMSPAVVESLLVTNPVWGWQGLQAIGGVNYGVLSTPNLQGYLSQPLDQKGLWQQLIPIKQAVSPTKTP